MDAVVSLIVNFKREDVSDTVINVTIFGKILPLWQSIQSWAIIDCLFTVWQNFEYTLTNFVYHWVSFR